METRPILLVVCAALAATAGCDGGLRRDPPCSRRGCRFYGSCTVREGPHRSVVGANCIAGSDGDCRQSLACRRYGKCFLSDHDRCIAGKDDDCQVSDHCATYGLCELRGISCSRRHASGSEPPDPCYSTCRSTGACRRDGATCLVASDADCRRSDGCVLSGNCSMSSDSPAVCEPASDHDCAASDSCFDHGTCSYRPGDGAAKRATCVVGSDEQCRRSLRCLVEKKCRKGEATGRRSTCVR